MKNSSIKKLETKLFNGYVAEPIPIVVIASIVAIAFLAVSLWATWDIVMYSRITTISTTECTIVDYRSDEFDYLLISDSGVFYTLPKAVIENSEILDKVLDENPQIVIEYGECISEQKEAYDIFAISNTRGESIIDSDAIKDVRTSANVKPLLILWSACAVYYVYIIGSYLILCNAPKYPRIASLLIRAPYRNF